ncbi:MAG: aconitase family protein, partial [Candidatus Nanopelagicales bacterium]
MSLDSFKTKRELTIGDRTVTIFDLTKIERANQLPFSLKILLENLLRKEDGFNVTQEHIKALVDWNPHQEPDTEIPYTPARVIMQDFTGVPAIVDLATMREAMADLSKDPQLVNPLAPAELVIDHSVIADAFGSSGAFGINVDLEYQRNLERYQFLRWGQDSFSEFKVVPPGTGIVHQVNIENLARVIFEKEGMAYPDTLVGTDSHTTMVNGLGVLGWGVGGIEAEAAMLGQPVSMLIPKVVGFKLTGALKEGVTATDLVLTITEILRKHKVVGKFVEFYGEGCLSIPLANRATIGNMSPEYGSTVAIFPIDYQTIDYLRFTGRSEPHLALIESYAKAQGMWLDPQHTPLFSEQLELDLASVEPSIAGPRRPQDRINLKDAKTSFEKVLPEFTEEVAKSAQVSLTGENFVLNHGAVVIAAIT